MHTKCHVVIVAIRSAGMISAEVSLHGAVAKVDRTGKCWEHCLETRE